MEGRCVSSNQYRGEANGTEAQKIKARNELYRLYNPFLSFTDGPSGVKREVTCSIPYMLPGLYCSY